jgi:hypothetical protein
MVGMVADTAPLPSSVRWLPRTNLRRPEPPAWKFDCIYHYHRNYTESPRPGGPSAPGIPPPAALPGASRRASGSLGAGGPWRKGRQAVAVQRDRNLPRRVPACLDPRSAGTYNACLLPIISIMLARHTRDTHRFSSTRTALRLQSARLKNPASLMRARIQITSNKRRLPACALRNCAWPRYVTLFRILSLWPLPQDQRLAFPRDKNARAAQPGQRRRE